MMQPNIRNISNKIPESISPELVPELIWPSVQTHKGHTLSYDSHKCPTLPDIYKKTGGNYECVVFWQQVTNSKKILIMDRYFDLFAYKHLYKSIQNALNQKLRFKEVKILYSNRDKTDEEKKLIQAKIKEIKKLFDSTTGSICQTKEIQRHINLLHDRFAVTDNEIWHFGSTVGGGHQSLNAVSRGWDDGILGFSKFFREIWREMR